ncbi:hypothetical protein GCM10010177_17060 [Actinomadura citrea]|nr:hypothetical protein GCM10010177_17060 [Actinomadura citrea]
MPYLRSHVRRVAAARPRRRATAPTPSPGPRSVSPRMRFGLPCCSDGTAYGVTDLPVPPVVRCHRSYGLLDRAVPLVFAGAGPSGCIPVPSDLREHPLKTAAKRDVRMPP